MKIAGSDTVALRIFGLLALLPLLLLTPVPAAAELSMSLYSGKVVTVNSDLDLKTADADLTFKDVSWTDHSFEGPIYYGVRATYWPESLAGWGVALDFAHAKTYLQSGTVTVTGTRDGLPVNGPEPITDTIEHFNMSHGLNMLTLNGLYRWFPAGGRDLSPLGRSQIYAGLGGGITIPHVEAYIDGLRTFEFQYNGGPVVNAMGGVNYDLTDFLSCFLEYKLSYADVHADLNGGGRIDVQPWTHHFIVGLSANIR